MFEQKKLMDVLLFGCNFSLSAHIQHFETAAGDISSCFRASDGTPARVEISSNIPQQKQKDYSLLEFFNFGINNKLSPLEIGILVCVWNPIYYLNMPPGFLDTSWNAFEARNPCWRGLGWVDKLGQTLCSGLQTRAN